MEGCGVETPEEFIDHCQDVFAKLDVYDASAPAYGWKAVSCFWPIANTDGKQEGLYVQLDFVVTTNMRFVTWGYHSPQEQEVKDGETMDDINPKTAVKLILLRSIAMGGQMKVNEYGDVPGEGEHLPTDIETYEFVFNEGLYKIHKVRKQKKNGDFSKVWMQVSKDFVTDDPDEIVKRAFGDPSINADDLLTTRDMWDAFIDSPLYEDENKRHEIGNIFKKIMKRQEGKYGYPSWMKFD